MALSPEDVVNKRFQPTKFREGYDQDEVDDFLDEVVIELRRLNQENEELRQRLVGSDSRVGEAPRVESADADSAVDESAEAVPVAAESTDEEKPAEKPEASEAQGTASAYLSAPDAVVPVPSPAYTAPVSEVDSTNNLLQLARRLHEEHVKEGVEKREALIAEGQVEAARLIDDAEAKSRDELARLERERAGVQATIDELRIFESEYRQKLKGYIESQLAELDATGPSSGTDDARGAKAGSTTVSQGLGGN